MEFIDTNILLYAYDTSEKDRHQRAYALISRLGGSREAAVSVQVLQEFYVNAVSKIATPLSPEQARRRLSVFSRWPTHSPLASDVIAAAALSETHRLSFWDAMILRSAVQMGCATLWSEDLNPKQVISGVTVRNPFA